MALISEEKKEKMKYFIINNLKYFVSTRLRTWYLIWFILISYYLYNHWAEAMSFSPFNGNALIFCVWVAMILKPFIKEIDTPWIKAKMSETLEEQKENKLTYDELVIKKAEEKAKQEESQKEKEDK